MKTFSKLKHFPNNSNLYHNNTKLTKYQLSNFSHNLIKIPNILLKTKLYTTNDYFISYINYKSVPNYSIFSKQSPNTKLTKFAKTSSSKHKPIL